MKSFTDAYLIDSYENELDLANCGLAPKAHESTNWTLALTDEERERLWRMRLTRTAVKKSDDVAMPESGHFYSNLEARIMDRVARLQEQKITERIESLFESHDTSSSDAIDSVAAVKFLDP